MTLHEQHSQEDRLSTTCLDTPISSAKSKSMNIIGNDFTNEDGISKNLDFDQPKPTRTTDSNKEIHEKITNKNNDDLPKKICVIALRIDTLLYNTLQNYLSAMHNVSDYTFSSISDILRHILLQIESGELQNSGVVRSDNKTTEITIRVNESQKHFWSSLPHPKRAIMEKAIISFTQKNK